MARRRASLLCATTLLFAGRVSLATLDARQEATAPPTALDHALPANASGEQIYQFACATCHGADGTGSPESVVGFALPLPNGHEFPDFTDCPTNTVEPLADWVAVATRGGPVRALDRHMPAFGDALTAEQIEEAVRYLWTFCTDPSWPRGELNLPRAFFTEKAFPENETVWTTGVSTSGARTLNNQLVYERRIGSRAQVEIVLPFGAAQRVPGGIWSRGIGDVELAVRRTFYASVERGSVLAAGAALVLPTGKENEGLGRGHRVYEPFAMWGQVLGTNGFVQAHTGYEISSDTAKGEHTGFARAALGYTFAQDQGFGRAWSPIAELLVERPSGGSAEWDVVPQVQVSLSKLQHVLINVGVRIPLNERVERTPQVLTYLLWDWFDGGLFDFWKSAP